MKSNKRIKIFIQHKNKDLAFIQNMTISGLQSFLEKREVKNRLLKGIQKFSGEIEIEFKHNEE